MLYIGESREINVYYKCNVVISVTDIIIYSLAILIMVI
jgi:hypothetical protein